jgi:DNA-binding CsgD family transcriptional regulator/tetratricopeptide (TPR) repeat protein
MSRGAAVRPGGLQLLQRADELAAIARAAADARAGMGSLALVDGPAGIGKTSLLRAAAASLQADDWRVLTARGFVLEGDYSYGVVRQLFDPLRLSAQAAWESALDGAAALARRAFEAVEVAAFDDDVPHATMHGLFWLAANLAAERPLALVVDDGHWADRASMRWLVHLARRLDGVPIVVILATRQGPGAWAPAELAALHEDAGTVLRPLPLDETAVTGLVQSRLGSGAGAETCRECHVSTGGNPFLLESLLAALQSAPAGPGEDTAAVVRRIGPEPVARAVLRRIGLLGDGSTALARSLAVLGKPSPLRLVSALAGCDVIVASRTADDLRAADVLASTELLDFAHPIVRAAVYDSIPPSERALAHAAAAERLRHDGADPEQLAPHLMRVEPSGRGDVAACLREAASAAMNRGSPDVALALLRRAAAEPPDPADLPGTMLDIGLALASLRDRDAPAALRRAVAMLAGQPGYVPAAVKAAGIVGALTFHHEAAAICRDVLVSGQPMDPAGLDLLEAELAANASPSPAGLAESRRLLAARRPDITPSLQRQAMSVLVDTIDGRPAPVNISALMSAIDTAGGQLPADSIIAMYIPLVLVWNGALAPAREVCIRATESARSRGSRSTAANMTSLHVMTAARLGLLREAVLDGKPAFNMKLTRAAPPLAVAWAASTSMEGLIELGRLEEADGIAAAALATKPPAGYYHTLHLMQTLGRLRLAQGRAAESVEILRAAGNELTRCGYVLLSTTWRADAALAHQALGHDHDAAALATENLRLARAAEDPYSLAIALRTYARCTSAHDAQALLTEAVACAEATHSGLALAYALLDLGAYLRRSGRRGEARAPLLRALDLAHRCGAVPLAERARHELIAAGSRPRRASVTGVDSLTATERRVADLAAGGLGNRQIAQHLFVTLPTIETHMRHVFQKLRITSRAQLAGHLGPSA